VAVLYVHLSPLFSSLASGSEVGTVRAQGLPEETVVYGVELAEEWEGVFSIDSESGRITVGPDGPDSLVIEVCQHHCML